MALVTAATGGFGLAVIALFMYLTARLSRRNELHLNDSLGLRTKDTKRSEQAWVSGHHAAEPGLVVAAAISVAAAVLALVVAVLLGPDQSSANIAALAALVLGYAIVLTLLLRAVRQANRAARAV